MRSPARTARGRGPSLKRMKGLPSERMRQQYTCGSGSSLLSDLSCFLSTLARLRPARSSVLCQCARGENEYSDESAFVKRVLRQLLTTHERNTLAGHTWLARRRAAVVIYSLEVERHLPNQHGAH